ncbi:ATP-binding cassette domain-containing protein [Patescibacteria group bacterium]|jgi:putative ABC transport system ATP-binding protein|nr:ATP-binding cassette domain-containing protein [Patescibacteria group bacterium]
MAKSIITTQEVEVTYNLGKSNEFKALRNINVEIMAREYVIFFGPSGCGKSTLLYSIFGVLPPSGGTVYVKGDAIYDYDPFELVQFQRQTMGIMYQQFNLIPSLTVLDNVALPLIFAGIPQAKRERKAMELLDRFYISHVAHKLPTNLSGGQQQRVSVARSLVTDPEILIADEPVGNLDSVSAEAVMNTLNSINQEDRKTILLVTHDAKHLPYAHRVFYLKDGRMDRIVANPEKEQVKKLRPGETIVTELEQAQRIYPYDTPAMIRVKSLLNYLTQSISFDQITRIQQVAEYAIEGKLSREAFHLFLKKPQAEGGVGLRPEYADELAERLDRILHESQDIIRFRKAHGSEPGVTDVAKMDIADDIATHLVRERGVELSAAAFQHLRASVESRVGGYIDKEEFKRQLNLAVEEGGAGLDPYLTHEVAWYLEKLIAQGVAEIRVQSKRAHNLEIMKAEAEHEAKKQEASARARQERAAHSRLWRFFHRGKRHKKGVPEEA